MGFTPFSCCLMLPDVACSFAPNARYQDGLQQRLAITKAKKKFLKLGCLDLQKVLTKVSSVMRCFSAIAKREISPERSIRTEEEKYLA